jgi:hypothetical protein
VSEGDGRAGAGTKSWNCQCAPFSLWPRSAAQLEINRSGLGERKERAPERNYGIYIRLGHASIDHLIARLLDLSPPASHISAGASALREQYPQTPPAPPRPRPRLGALANANRQNNSLFSSAGPDSLRNPSGAPSPPVRGPVSNRSNFHLTRHHCPRIRGRQTAARARFLLSLSLSPSLSLPPSLSLSLLDPAA